MIRTQISLDEEEYALAKKEAAALGISVAELVRRAVRRIDTCWSADRHLGLTARN